MVTRGVEEGGITEVLLDQAQGGHAVVPVLEGGSIERDEIHLSSTGLLIASHHPACGIVCEWRPAVQRDAEL